MKFSLIASVLLLITQNALYASPDTAYVNRIYDKAWECIESGNNGKAITLLEEIEAIKKGCTIDINPPYYKLYNILGVLHKNLGHFQTAFNYYKVGNLGDLA